MEALLLGIIGVLCVICVMLAIQLENIASTLRSIEDELKGR